MSDEKMIPASEWRKREDQLRSYNTGFGPTWMHMNLVLADACAREAEKAEAREKCERGERVVCTARRPIPAGAYCGREHNHCGVHICNLGCCKWSDAEPSDRERLREDVREEIALQDSIVSGGQFERHARVRAAELRDFYRRTFGEECP